MSCKIRERPAVTTGVNFDNSFYNFKQLGIILSAVYPSSKVLLQLLSVPFVFRYHIVAIHAQKFNLRSQKQILKRRKRERSCFCDIQLFTTSSGRRGNERLSQPEGRFGGRSKF